MPHLRLICIIFRKKNLNVKFVKISENNKNIINIKLCFGFKTFYWVVIFIQKSFKRKFQTIIVSGAFVYKAIRVLPVQKKLMSLVTHGISRKSRIDRNIIKMLIVNFRFKMEVFVYQVIDSYGGPVAFYKDYYIGAVCPLGFT